MGRDWTFAGNAGDYTIRTLQVYVLPASPPAITTPSAQSTVQGTAASLQISASTSSGKSLSYSASGLPSGLSINAGTGLISGTVSTGAAAASTVTVTVSDGTLSASTSFIWNTTVANRPPVIVTPGSQTTVRGAAASLQLVASDPEGQVLTYSASGLPAGLSLNVSTGLISGTVSSGAAASNAVTVSASDGSLSASTTFNWATTAPITPPPATVLSGSDIGSPGLAGSDSVAAGVYTVTGGGKDIWDSSDQFHYVAQTFSGDGQIIVRVTSQTGSEAWTKAGIMFRETLNANSSFAAMELTQSVGTTFQYRSVTGGACGYNSAASNPAPNNWLRLVRQGNIFTGYVSSDGVTWTQVGTATIPMAVSINVGLAVTAHNNGLLSTATFDNLVISSPAASSGNRPPVVTTPVSQSTLRGTSGSLQIVASDPDGQSLSYAASGLPAGLSINPSSGLISGTVSNAAAATNYVTVTVSDGSLTASASFNWTVTTSPSLPLPVPLTGSDIGNPGLAGSDSYANGVYTVTGGGGDIWNTSDHFHYLSQTFTGDGQIIVRVTSQDASEIWAKAGIMFRETLNANSCCAAIVLTPGNGISFQYRSATGGGCGFTTAPSNPAPNNWLCLVRQGNVFTGYASSDGVTWTQVGSATVPMAVVVNVGLVVTAHNEGLLSTATFDNFQLKP
jgi:regulation of enolase protein 1 (concanavalin A-like superfamily)